MGDASVAPPPHSPPDTWSTARRSWRPEVGEPPPRREARRLPRLLDPLRPEQAQAELISTRTLHRASGAVAAESYCPARAGDEQNADQLPVTIGLQKGRLEAAQNTARNVINLGVLSDGQIARATDLRVEQVAAL